MATRRTSWSAPITGEPNRIAPAQDGPAEAGPFFFCAVRSRKPEDPRRQKQHLTEDQVGQMQYLSFDHTFVTSSFLGADASYPRLLLRDVGMENSRPTGSELQPQIRTPYSSPTASTLAGPARFRAAVLCPRATVPALSGVHSLAAGPAEIRSPPTGVRRAREHAEAGWVRPFEIAERPLCSPQNEDSLAH